MAFIWTENRSICISIDPVSSKYTHILSVTYKLINGINNIITFNARKPLTHLNSV